MWDKITVGKFQQLHDITAGQAFDNDVERRVHVLACLDGKDPETYYDMPVGQLMDEMKKTHFLSVDNVPSVAAPKRISINGVDYEVIYDFTRLTAGQLIDAINETKSQDEHVMRLHRILAAISVPVGKKYGDVPFDEVADCMLSAPILDAQAISLFFCAVWNSFLEGIPAYLAKRVRKQKKGKNWKHLAEALESVGVGSLVQQR